MHRRTAVLLVGTAAALVPPVAGGTTVVAPSGRAYDPFSLAADRAAAGRAVVAWTLASPRATVQAAERPRAGARFGRPVTLGRGRVARAALSPRGGHAVVARVDGGRVQLATRRATGGWRQAALPAGTPGGQGVRVSGLEVWEDGAAVATVEVRAPSRYRVAVLERRAGGGRPWRLAAVRDVPDSAGGQAVVEGRGAVTVVWLAVEARTTVVRAVRRPFGASRFGAVEEVVRGAPGAPLGEPQVAVGAGDRVAVLAGVPAEDGEILAARVATRRGAGRWTVSAPWPATSVAVGGDEVWAARTVAGRRGTAVQTRRMGADGRWQAPRTVRAAAPRRIAGGPGLVVPRPGHPVAWWAAEAARGADRWYAASRRPRGWGAPRLMGATDGAVEFGVGGGGALAVLVAPGGGGRVVAAELP
ncbi:MAG TPA: hypothetical protein VNT51_00895 [Miltoncostaeaceae bacterium]|nr:hypothetical protein [Miltoncostaeaceae bacterium]